MVGHDAGFVVGYDGRFGVGFGVVFVVGYGQTGTMPTASKTNCVFKNCTEASDHGKGTKSLTLF